MFMLLACRKCKRLFEGKKCPKCGIDGTRNWQGMIVIFDTESEIAKKLEITEPGKYAVKV